MHFLSFFLTPANISTTDRRVPMDAPRLAHQLPRMGADGHTHRVRLARYARLHLVRRETTIERADSARRSRRRERRGVARGFQG